ncbi:uncharacterized protein LOC125031504 isoform X2 [Penaeus chinensis]|nr:uncharacterized protein LOC125031504 isoform X2 [Penaeus chinensis]XP_047478321.1 uncharacterized protein LOC125031504 isoform X2 [Penaeus chinensis]
MWLLRPRHRNLLRSAAVVSALVSVVLFLSSAFLLDDSAPLPRSSLVTSPPAATASPLALQLTQSQPQQDGANDLRDKLPSQVSSDKNDFFNPYKGKVIERKVVKKISGDDKKKKKVESTDRKGAGGSGGREPSFGFVNKDFQSPYNPHARNPLVETFENIVNGEYGINPGMVLGAVAALQQSKSLSNGGERIENSHRGSNGEERVRVRNEERIVSSKERLKGVMLPGASGGKDLRDGSIGDKATRGTPIKPRKENRNSQGSKQNILGSLLTQIGPSILGGALSKTVHSGQGSPQGPPQGSPLKTLISEVGPSLLSGILQNGKDHSGPGGGGGESSPLQSIVSGLGPLLLAGAVSQGLGGNGRDKDTQSPIQSMISNLGPQLMSNVLKQGLGVGKGRSQDPSPVESIISGLGPLLGNAMQRSFQGDNSKSPVVSILGGLGSSLLSGISKKSQGNARHNGAPKRNTPRVQGPQPQEPSRQREQTDNNNNNRSLPAAPSPGSPNFREGKDPRQEPEGLKEVHPWAGEGEEEHRTEDNNNAAAPNPLLRRAAGSLLEQWLPDRLSVPKANSTRGAWQMAVNLALGNPKDKKGRRSQFWSWLRQLSGSDQKASHAAADWILRALNNPARAAHARAISDFYDAVTRVRPICQSAETVGGLYNWKKDVLEGSKVVCMDPDVTPKKRGCVVYSFGVEDEWSFEEEMEGYGCEVWAFDAAMTTGNHNHSDSIHFYNIGLAASNTTRDVRGQTWNLFTYPAVVAKLGHSKTAVSYLNLDAAGSEWEILKEAMQDSPHILTNVHQLGVKVHLDLALKDPALYQVNLNTLRDLESYGFQLFSSVQEEARENVYFDPLPKRTVSLTYDLVFLRI